MAEVLSDGGKPIRYVYFPIEGFISLVTRLDGKPVLEVGMVGRRRDDRRTDGLGGYEGAFARRSARSGIGVALRATRVPE